MFGKKWATDDIWEHYKDEGFVDLVHEGHNNTDVNDIQSQTQTWWQADESKLPFDEVTLVGGGNSKYPGC